MRKKPSRGPQPLYLPKLWNIARQTSISAFIGGAQRQRHQFLFLFTWLNCGNNWFFLNNFKFKEKGGRNGNCCRLDCKKHLPSFLSFLSPIALGLLTLCKAVEVYPLFWVFGGEWNSFIEEIHHTTFSVGRTHSIFTWNLVMLYKCVLKSALLVITTAVTFANPLEIIKHIDMKSSALWDNLWLLLYLKLWF